MIEESSADYHARLIEVLTKAIFEASLINLDGKKTAYVRSTEACEAMISVIGMMMEGAPACETPQGMRKMSETVGRNVLAAMKAARKLRELNGRSVLGADGVVIN